MFKYLPPYKIEIFKFNRLSYLNGKRYKIETLRVFLKYFNEDLRLGGATYQWPFDMAAIQFELNECWEAYTRRSMKFEKLIFTIKDAVNDMYIS
jgi:hypothetical protein